MTNFIELYKQYNDKVERLKEDNIKRGITSWNKEMSDELYEFIKNTFNLETQTLKTNDSVQTKVAYFNLDNVLITDIYSYDESDINDSFTKELKIQIGELNSIAEEVFILPVMRTDFVNKHYNKGNENAIGYINRLKLNGTYYTNNYIGGLKNDDLLNKKVSFTVQVTVSMFGFMQLHIILDTFVIN